MIHLLMKTIAILIIFLKKLKCETCSFEIRSNIEDLSLCCINCENFWSDYG